MLHILVQRSCKLWPDLDLQIKSDLTNTNLTPNIMSPKKIFTIFLFRVNIDQKNCLHSSLACHYTQSEKCILFVFFCEIICFDKTNQTWKTKYKQHFGQVSINWLKLISMYYYMCSDIFIADSPQQAFFLTAATPTIFEAFTTAQTASH